MNPNEDGSQLIVGIMSGTSLDGIDVALVDVINRGGDFHYQLQHFHSFPWPSDLKPHLLRACAGEMSMREIFALDVDLGGHYAAAVKGAAHQAGIDLLQIHAIGLHGQTVWHEPRRKPHGLTVQIGSPSVLAEEIGCTVVNDFRSADVAAGGEGAPLVPFCDLMLLASSEKNRIALNIGGIANVTWLPVGVAADTLIAFDTGPGNALIDAAMRELRGMDYDAEGTLAGRGIPDEVLLLHLLNDPWFSEPPPKSTGRERFGEEWGRRLAADARANGMSDADIIATLTLFTARTIAEGIRRFAAIDAAVDEVIASGGGAHNRTLLRMIGNELPGTTVRSSDYYNIPSDAKEAFCFAILAHATLCGTPNNVPSVTGARKGVVGGSIRNPQSETRTPDA